MEGLVRITEQRGSAREIARSMIVDGATTVVAWGGDGTINEVAAEVAPAGVTLGVVPSGSGNGFARGLGLERRAEAALRTALIGPVRLIDTGEIDGRIFVNVAGIGFDAHLAAVFNRLRQRGATAYFRAGFRELRSYRGQTYTVRTRYESFTMPAFLVAVANRREYGNGAVSAAEGAASMAAELTAGVRGRPQGGGRRGVRGRARPGGVRRWGDRRAVAQAPRGHGPPGRPRW